MRGVLVRDWTAFENLRLEACPSPEAFPGRLRTQAAGVSLATSLVVSGRYQRRPPLPFVPRTEDAMAAVLGRRAVGRVAVVMDEEARRLAR